MVTLENLYESMKEDERLQQAGVLGRFGGISLNNLNDEIHRVLEAKYAEAREREETTRPIFRNGDIEKMKAVFRVFNEIIPEYYTAFKEYTKNPKISEHTMLRKDAVWNHQVQSFSHGGGTPQEFKLAMLDFLKKNWKIDLPIKYHDAPNRKGKMVKYATYPAHLAHKGIQLKILADVYKHKHIDEKTKQHLEDLILSNVAKDQLQLDITEYKNAVNDLSRGLATDPSESPERIGSGSDESDADVPKMSKDQIDPELLKVQQQARAEKEPKPYPTDSWQKPEQKDAPLADEMGLFKPKKKPRQFDELIQKTLPKEEPKKIAKKVPKKVVKKPVKKV
jgi:hypothetical protein